MQELIGLKIQKIKVSQDGKMVVFMGFRQTGWPVEARVYQTDADCCNNVWINDILGFKPGTDPEVIEILQRDTVALDQPSNQGVLDQYGISLKTTSGYIDILYRNDHNGYYGGRINLLVLDPVTLDEFMEQMRIDISGDWTI